MQKRIFLHTTDYNPTDKKLNAKEIFAALKKVRDVSFNQFRESIKSSKYSKIIKIIAEEELSPQVVIEFADKLEWEIYEFLRTVKVVELIDSIV